MASFGDQFEASRRANLAVRAMEVEVRLQVAEAFAAWARGEYTDQTIRHRLEAIVRDAYRASASIGLAHISEQAGIPRWTPKWLPKGVIKSSYLNGLVADVQRNLRAFKASQRTSADLTRAVSRISHSAGVAAARGQTDALLRSAKELAERHGFILRKVWMANFLNHTPCELCAGLHMTEVDIDAEFPVDNRLKVYGDLKGPPRHPRCVCRLVILIVGLENYLEEASDIESDEPTAAPEVMDTETVKNLRKGFFNAVTSWLQKLVRFLKRSSSE